MTKDIQEILDDLETNCINRDSKFNRYQIRNEIDEWLHKNVKEVEQIKFNNQEDFTEVINNFILQGKEQGFSTKDISDKWHTFDDLYYHRMMLFAVICNQNKGIAWKSKLHSDGTMFEDSFIIGINTPMGQYTYHYHLKDWDMFEVKVLERAPEYDGHKPEHIYRVFSILEVD